MTKLPIHERFFAIQGEGNYLGRSAFFIRTFGCPLHCPWCDSAGTWHKDYKPTNIERLSIDELVNEAVDCNPEFVVITGGEPTIHKDALKELDDKLFENDLRLHIETSGSFELADLRDDVWITVSPKWSKHPLRQTLERANELKIIVENPNSIDLWEKQIDQEMGEGWFKSCSNIWLHPEWTQRDNPEVLNTITEYIKKNGKPFKAGWQLHKLYDCDSLDNRSANKAPLGGDITKGY